MLDVVIVGAGPAGLSAALVLGRCCRRVLVCDTQRPRNAASRAVHGFVTRDGISPGELRRLGREQLVPYTTVQLLSAEVRDAARGPSGFDIRLGDGSHRRCRKLLLASGIVDQLPDVPGFSELWGRGVYPCPYCDAWEVRGQRLAVYGRGEHALGLCRALTGWTSDIYLFSDGATELSEHDERSLSERGICVRQERVSAIRGSAGRLSSVVLEGDVTIERDALFTSAPQCQPSALALKLGCNLNRTGQVETGTWESTETPGLYVAGDASRDVQLAIVAAAAGARAAFDINRALVHDAFYGERAASA